MRAPLFNNNEFLDETSFNNAYGLVTDSLVDITGNLHTPGLINASALSFSYSGLTITIDAPLPFRALFSDGTLASANGTVDGESSSSATVDFSSLVPSTGSITAYLVAVSGSVLQQPSVQPGPPVGHPDYNPSFSPYTAYSEQQDTLIFSATLTAPDNATTLLIASTVLSAGQTVITTSSTVGQVRAGAILSQNGEVLAADLGSGAAASNVGTLGGSLVGTLPNPTLASTGATSGTYINPVTITVDSDGRVSNIANVSNWNVPGNVTAGGSMTAVSAQINGNLTATGSTSLKGTTIGGLLAASTYNIAGGTTGYNNTGLTIGWNFTNGQGEVDLLLGPQGGAGGINIYQLNSSGAMVSTTPIAALSSTGTLTLQGEVLISPATQNHAAVPYGQAFQLLSGTPPSTITLGNTLKTVAQYTLTAATTIVLEPGSVVGQEITIYGGAYALTVNSNVTTGSPYIELPDGSQVYSWVVPAGASEQGIHADWDGTNWRARTFGQAVVAPATASNESVNLGQLFIGNRKSVFTANGTFTVPSAVTTIWVSGCGGGGGGGGGNVLSTTAQGAGGGGGYPGEIAIKNPIAVTPGEVLTITVGAAGAGGAGTSSLANAGNGTAGGSSIVSSGNTNLLTLAGGSGGSGATAYSSTSVFGGTGYTMGLAVFSITGSTTAPDGGGVIGYGGAGGSGPFGTGGGSGGSGGGNGSGGGGGGSGSGGRSGSPGLIIIEW